MLVSTVARIECRPGTDVERHLDHVSDTAGHARLTELRSILREIEDAGWEYARIEIDDVTLVVASDHTLVADHGFGRHIGEPVETVTPAGAQHTSTAPEAVAAPAPTPAETPAQAAIQTEPVPSAVPISEGPVETVTSPTIGLFWRSPKPGAPPFVAVGDAVSAGDTLCIIEVMKLMTHVTSPVDGTVRAIHMDNGSMVEHGTALIDIEHAGSGS